MTNYIITQTEIHHVSAESVHEANILWNEGVFDCATSINVEIVEADFQNGLALGDSQNEIEEKVCPDCGRTLEGWHKGSEVTTTFKTLKTVQNEEFVRGVRLAMDYLENINYHDGANALDELLEMLAGTTPTPEWQKPFFAEDSHRMYSTECER